MTEIVYKIFETNEYLKRISKLNKGDAAFIQNKLTLLVYPLLRIEPHFGNNIKKLVNYKPETWRYRIGKYRLFFGINEHTKVVSILTVEFRKDAY